MNASSPDLTWILGKLVALPGARHALVASADGIVVAYSPGVDRDLADSVAAITSGMQALSRNGAAFVEESTGWEQTMVNYAAGYLFILTASEGSYLVVSAGRDTDIEQLSYQMAKTVDGLGTALGVGPRHRQDSPA
ncbi:dynein regulation protein LC7 [Streptomyces subrutilus]|uniref:Dynein regulation protein LC7 n=1 Tax=Streptomyces subrutilus TaxID=36818 RepID=A0A918RDS4_9ACTN|nr:roadblock/LC7 domain-containing protein [Streptomyces subrutilus]GGZ95074.1 dynein regulation protein LC7 [Streptomyces subrutilus]